jgi:aryl-alcohol dehydrogenase-like predicted oxidoreductase
MRSQKLGSKGPEISVIGFGAWEAGGDMWGPNESEAEIVEAIQAGLDAGITWIDTAEVYGDGTSEEIVARAIQGRREDIFLATKVAPEPSGTGHRAEQVREACQKSLKRLSTDWIDLYQLHWPDDTGAPLDETWEAMAGLADEGLVRHIGMSNYGQSEIERCEAIRHVDSLQPQFSMLYLDLRDVIRWSGDNGIGVVAYGPLAFGLLTGAIDQTTRFHERDWRSGGMDMDAYDRMFAPGKIERSLSVVDAMRPIARRIGISVAQLALAWVFHQPGVTSAIAGTRNPKHVRENAEAGDVTLDRETLQELEGILELGPDFAERE